MGEGLLVHAPHRLLLNAIACVSFAVGEGSLARAAAGILLLGLGSFLPDRNSDFAAFNLLPVVFVLSFPASVVSVVFLGVLLEAPDIYSPFGFSTLWLGFVIPTMVVNYAFHGARQTLTLIDGGHWLGVLLIQGAILGWWGVR